MAEQQAANRRSMEHEVVSGSVTRERLGQSFGFTIVMTAIIGGIYLIASDKDTAGLTSIISGLVSLTGIFVVGKYQQTKERKAKRRDLQLPLPYDRG